MRKMRKMHAINNIHWPSRKGRQFMVKEIKTKTSVIKFKKKGFEANKN